MREIFASRIRIDYLISFGREREREKGRERERDRERERERERHLDKTERR